MEIDEERNRVVGNQDAKEHVAHIFDEVIPKMCKTDVAIDIIGMGDGGPTIAEYLQENWEKKWEGRVRCVAVGSGAIWLGEKIEGDGKFHRFWADVSRVLFIFLRLILSEAIRAKQQALMTGINSNHSAREHTSNPTSPSIPR